MKPSNNPDKELRKNFRKHIRNKRRNTSRRRLAQFFSRRNRQADSQGIIAMDPARMNRIGLKQMRKQKRFRFFKNLIQVLQNRNSVINSLKILGTSTLCGIIALTAVYFLNQAITIFIAKIFGIPIVWKDFRYYYPLSTGSLLYSRFAIIFIFSAGPVSSLLIALIAGNFFFEKGQYNRFLKYGLAWSIFYGYNFMFGSLISGIITRTDAVYATLWILMNTEYDYREVIVLFLSITALLVTGYRLGLKFIFALNNSKWIKPGIIGISAISSIILPWMTCMILFTIISLPGLNIAFLLKLISSAIILPFLLVSFFSENSTNRLHRRGLDLFFRADPEG
ncbi:MAG: hypothetical protein IPH88_10065 [Bacteroidales bacterium]|nr:hypothetical protein [Bacteroidales bacterium]